MTLIAGIVNLTPDSFSQDGLLGNAEYICQHIARLCDEGADIVDVGAESTRPGAQPLTAQEEWARLEAVLRLAQQQQLHTRVKISIDSYHPENIARALQFGVRMVNDVTGLEQPEMLALAASSNAEFVAMHALTVPANRTQVIAENEDPVHVITQWHENLLRRLQHHNIDLARIYFDPGIGFGKTAEQSLRLLTHFEHYATQPDRWYVGHSRKSFFRLFSAVEPSARDGLTAVFSAKLLAQNVGVLRVHDVARHVRMKKAVCRAA
jgi:dihydropteroate synthase